MQGLVFRYLFVVKLTKSVQNKCCSPHSAENTSRIRKQITREMIFSEQYCQCVSSGVTQKMKWAVKRGNNTTGSVNSITGLFTVEIRAAL
jgi:hypothetical protein